MMRLALLASLVLPGCAAFVEHDWDEHASHRPLMAYHVAVSDALLEKACGSHPPSYVLGCAVRIPSENACVIYTRPTPAAWLIEHEDRHCAGFDHGKRQAL